MLVRAPEKASKFRKWANDMLGNADVSKPRATGSRDRSKRSFHVKRKKRRKTRRRKRHARKIQAAE